MNNLKFTNPYEKYSRICLKSNKRIMKNFTKIMGIGIMLISMFSITKADHLADRLLFSSRLNGNNIIPSPVNTAASGVAGFMLNNTRDTLYMNFSATGMSGAITGFHIHEGTEKQNGPVILDLQDAIMGNIAKARIVVTPELLTKFLKSQVYLVAHTTTNPNGEIRGQIKLESDFGNYAELDAMQQVPMNNSNAKGVAAINLGIDNKRLEVKVVIDGLSGAIQGAHLHRGKMGENGGLLVDLSSLISNNGNAIFGSVIVDDSIKNLLQSYIRNGEVYLNLHTAMYPNGEVRGQIKYDQNLRFDARIDTTQITGNLSAVSSAIGAAKFSLNTSFDTLRYYITVTNLTGAIAAAHIHNAEPNQNGGVVFEFPTSSINGNIISGIWTKSTGLTDMMINELLYGNLYVAVHTALNPAGELRGQIFRLAREGFMADIDAMQSVPSSNSMANGSGIVSYDRDRTSLHYMITVNGLSGAINAAHFHKGIKGETGGVVYDLNFVNNATFGYWDFTNMPAFNNTQSITFRRNDSVYVNFHTSNFPNGEIRGQFIRNYKNMGIILNKATGIFNTEKNKIDLNIYPNPASTNLSINFTTAESTNISYEIIDLTGRILKSFSQTAELGKNIIDVNISDIQSGVYMIRLRDDSKILSNSKFIIQ